MSVNLTVKLSSPLNTQEGVALSCLADCLNIEGLTFSHCRRGEEIVFQSDAEFMELLQKFLLATDWNDDSFAPVHELINRGIPGIDLELQLDCVQAKVVSATID